MAALFAVDDDVPEPMRYKAEMFKRRTELLRDEIVCCLDWLNPDQVDRLGTPIAVAVEALDEVLLRLGVPFPGEAEDPEDDPFIFDVKPWVGPE